MILLSLDWRYYHRLTSHSYVHRFPSLGPLKWLLFTSGGCAVTELVVRDALEVCRDLTQLWPPPTPRHRLTQNKEHGSNTKPGNNSVKTGPTRNKWVRSTTQEDDGEQKKKPKPTQKKKETIRTRRTRAATQIPSEIPTASSSSKRQNPPKKKQTKKQKNVANSAPISIRSASNVLASSWYQTQ